MMQFRLILKELDVILSDPVHSLWCLESKWTLALSVTHLSYLLILIWLSLGLKPKFILITVVWEVCTSGFSLLILIQVTRGTLGTTLSKRIQGSG